MPMNPFEYAVRECGPKAQDREKLINQMAVDGWEPSDVRAAPWWGWSSKDQITFRRLRS